MRSACLGLPLVAVLSACGGGGDSPAPPVPPPSSVAALTAWKSVLSTPRTLAVAGTGSDGKAYSLSYTISTAGSVTVNGQATNRVDITAILRSGGVVASTSSESLFVRTGTGLVHAVSRPDGSCGLVAAPSEPPATAQLLAGGQLYATDIQSSCKGVDFSFERETSTWSIESEESTAFFCVRTALSGTAVGLGRTQQVCLQSSADGTIGAASRVTVTQGTTFTLVMR